MTYIVLFIHAGLPPSPPPSSGSMNNGPSIVNNPFAGDVRNQGERKSKSIILRIVLPSVFAFILCAGASLVIYFKLRNKTRITEASLIPPKPAGSKTFCSWVIITFFISLWGTFSEAAKNALAEPLFCSKHKLSTSL
jgi:hypothetical protein